MTQTDPQKLIQDLDGLARKIITQRIPELKDEFWIDGCAMVLSTAILHHQDQHAHLQDLNVTTDLLSVWQHTEHHSATVDRAVKHIAYQLQQMSKVLVDQFFALVRQALGTSQHLKILGTGTEDPQWWEAETLPLTPELIAHIQAQAGAPHQNLQTIQLDASDIISMTHVEIVEVIEEQPLRANHQTMYVPPKVMQEIAVHHTGDQRKTTKFDARDIQNALGENAHVPDLESTTSIKQAQMVQLLQDIGQASEAEELEDADEQPTTSMSMDILQQHLGEQE